ncbi:hypothetical protein QJS66_12580 [Kocuria rhizophila]|nr:hypothetical protein QJS66_12580 [Kocuria rhizophila]
MPGLVGGVRRSGYGRELGRWASASSPTPSWCATPRAPTTLVPGSRVRTPVPVHSPRRSTTPRRHRPRTPAVAGTAPPPREGASHGGSDKPHGAGAGQPGPGEGYTRIAYTRRGQRGRLWRTCALRATSSWGPTTSWGTETWSSTRTSTASS